MESTGWTSKSREEREGREEREEPVKDEHVDYLLQQELRCFHEAVTNFNEEHFKL